MAGPLLVQLFDRLPELRAEDDEELWAAGVQDALREFRAAVREKYSEGTLQRLLASNNPRVRRAAVLALGFVGTLESNASVAASLRDEDSLVQRFAADALWELWFRGGTPEQNTRLREAVSAPDPNVARADLDDLIASAPHFAEAYNQRAILHYKHGEFARAVEDCEATLRLNPFHFGAAAGMGECLRKLGKTRAALRAYQSALEINPALEHLRDTIQKLERSIDRGE